MSGGYQYETSRQSKWGIFSKVRHSFAAISTQWTNQSSYHSYGCQRYPTGEAIYVGTSTPRFYLLYICEKPRPMFKPFRVAHRFRFFFNDSGKIPSQNSVYWIVIVQYEYGHECLRNSDFRWIHWGRVDRRHAITVHLVGASQLI